MALTPGTLNADIGVVEGIDYSREADAVDIDILKKSRIVIVGTGGMYEGASMFARCGIGENKFDKSNLYASFLTKKPDCNLLIIRQSTLPISSNFYDLFEENTTSLSLFDDVVWLNPECERREMNIDDTRKIFP